MKKQKISDTHVFVLDNNDQYYNNVFKLDLQSQPQQFV